MPHLPALITSGDVMPGGGDLNGRRWAGHQLLRAWARFASKGDLTLAHGYPDTLLACSLGLRSLVFKANSNDWVWSTLNHFETVVGCFCQIHQLAAGRSGVRPLAPMRFH